MHADHQPSDPDCPGCPGCRAQDHSASEGPDKMLPSGWRLGLVSMGLFLAPCILAIVGAACFGKSHAAQLSGAVTGLLAGMIGSVAVASVVPSLREGWLGSNEVSPQYAAVPGARCARPRAPQPPRTKTCSY